MPMLEKLYKLPTDTEGTFHSEVYFINMATQMGVKWGTDSKVRLFDPTSGLHVELGASGEFNIRVVNARKLLLRVVGTTANLRQADLFGGKNLFRSKMAAQMENNLASAASRNDIDALEDTGRTMELSDKLTSRLSNYSPELDNQYGGRGFFRAMVMTQVKSYLAAAIREKGISVLEIDERLMELSEALREKINPRLAEYGLEMAEFFVSRVVTPDDDPNFRRMKEQFAEQYLGVRQEEIRRREAEAAARRKAVEAQGEAEALKIQKQGEAEALKIQKQAEAEAYRMQAAAEAEEMRMKGYTYQQETARKVGMEAMQHGITGNGGGVAGGLGDLAGLGVTLGAMGSVVGMTRDALNPVMDAAAQMGRAVGGAIAPDGWDCPDCGQKGIASNFCPNCGRKRPAPDMGWTCPDCGQKGIASNFCPNCGTSAPRRIRAGLARTVAKRESSRTSAPTAAKRGRVKP